MLGSRGISGGYDFVKSSKYAMRVCMRVCMILGGSSYAFHKGFIRVFIRAALVGCNVIGQGLARGALLSKG